MLYVKELLIVLHELAHVLLDHREPSHQAEYHANHLAYHITKNVVAKKRPLRNEKFLLVTHVDLFKDMQYLSGARESKNHPLAFSRLVTLVNSAKALEKALIYGDDREYEQLLRSMPALS
ncbi:hypothetical protein [Paenibacillus alvei]|uniref:IrrE N-terminal-like domain-containing protein n=1 Tax=Paenibacillus alvei TaxID=44250 RepID=A0A383RJ83_PAEAL|nr:hypothetical protein [Paenibacillus alvei]SYX86913.1 protein of unknown function [Paenibacillus alvei]